MDFAHLALSVTAVLTALALRPWRALGPAGPPWPWLAWCLLLPTLWGADRYVQIPLAQPLSGACLLLLMGGWPLAVLALMPVAALTAWLAGLGPAEALDRYVWLGLVPATLGLALGAAIRRWLPRHLMVYILGRGFFATLFAGTLAGLIALAVHGVPGGLVLGDAMLGRWLAAWGDAWLTGMLAAIFVAFRPQWLATYADKLYLPDDRPARRPKEPRPD
jgi:uncharacterized membrane protein